MRGTGGQGSFVFRHGTGAPHYQGAGHGRPVFDGQYRRIRSCVDRRHDPAQDVSHDDDGGRHYYAREGTCAGRGSGGVTGNRHRQAVGRGGFRLRRASSGQRANRKPGCEVYRARYRIGRRPGRVRKSHGRGVLQAAKGVARRRIEGTGRCHYNRRRPGPQSARSDPHNGNGRRHAVRVRHRGYRGKDAAATAS